MSNRLKWLDRSAFQLPIYFTIATSRDLLDKELKRMKFNGSLGVTSGKSATTNFLNNSNGETCAIVCLFDRKKIDKLQIYSLIAHEAVHIFQEVKNILGEKEPSKEFEAYTIQKIFQDLLYEYERQTKKHQKIK